MTAGARTIARAGLVVTAAFFVSRVLGWLRTVVLGVQFGAGAELDAFFAAFRIPDLIFQLVAAGALSSALIPIVAGLTEKGQDERAWRVVSTVTNLMLLGLLGLAVLVAVAAPVLVPAITPGFDVVGQARTAELTRIMLLSPVFLALGAVATSVLNARSAFGASSVAPLIYNVAIIAAALFLAPAIGIDGLAIGVVLGALGHFAIQLRPLLRGGFRYEPVLDLADPQARQALALMAPRALGLGASQFTFVVMNSLASTLSAGAISAFTIAFTLLQIPIGVIGVPLGIVVFPSMARELARGAVREYTALLTRSLRLLLYVMLPIAALAAITRRQVVTLLFAYGEFSAAAVELTANTFLFFLLGLAAHALIAVLARAFYARQDTRTPVLAALVAVAVDVVLGIVLLGPIGLSGLALAIAIGAWVETLLLIWALRRQVPTLDLGGVLRVFLEAGLAAALAGVLALATVYFLDSVIGPDPTKPLLLAQLVLAGSVFGVVYVATSLALRIPELPSIVGVMADLIRRPGR